MMGQPPALLIADEKDAGLREELLKHADGEPPLWHRGMALAGDDDLAGLRAEVQKAGMVVALISSDLLGGPLREVLDLAISRELNGQCRLVPVLARQVLPDERIAALRMLPSDGKPVFPRRDRDAAWVDVVKGLREAFAALPPPRRQRPGFQAGASAQLTVSLLPDRVRYIRALGGVLGEAPAGNARQAAARGDGEALFRVLFPDDAAWQRVLQKVVHAPVGQHPAGHDLRVRVHAADPACHGMLAWPWHKAAYRGLRMLDWTYEATLAELATGPCDLRLPCAVVAAGEAAGAAFLPSLHEKLALVAEGGRQADEDHLRLAPTPEALARRLAEAPPALVYLAGRADPAWLEALDRAAPEHLLALCLSGPGWVDLAPRAAARLPLVAVARGGDETGQHQGVLAFLDACLAQGKEPVRAAAELELVLYTRYQTWAARAVAVGRPWRHAHLRVDRDVQRALVEKHVADLQASKDRRVEALVAYAAPRNKLDEFWRQALDYLDRRGVPYRRIPLSLPGRRGDDLRLALPEELRRQLGAREGEPTPSLLRRWAVGGARVLWLDWGCHQEGALQPADLKRLLQFSQAELCRDCPPDLRIVSYVALELPAEKHQKLERFVEGCETDLFQDRFRCTLLPALGQVKKKDLLNFLSDPANTTCTPMQMEKAARLIDEHARGDYEHTVALIEEAERVTWSELLRRLSGGEGEEDDDEGRW